MAVIAALEREIKGLIAGARQISSEHDGRVFNFFERDDTVSVAAGIGLEAARRAAEAAVALYHPTLLHSVGFAGALQADLQVGAILVPALLIDGRDGSRVSLEGGSGILLTSPHVATVEQKAAFARAYNAHAVDMEAAAVAIAAHSRGIAFCATKTISDGFDFEMPDMARFIDGSGHFKSAHFAFFAVLRPWLWPRIYTLAVNSNKAAKALADYLMDTRHLRGEAIETKTI